MDKHEKKLWVQYRHYEAICTHYERKNLLTNDRIFAEANMMRAAKHIMDHAFATYKQRCYPIPKK